jgi:hypothetical protein
LIERDIEFVITPGQTQIDEIQLLGGDTEHVPATNESCEIELGGKKPK